MPFKSLILPLTFLLLLNSCSQNAPVTEEIDAAYLAEVEQWRTERISNLKKPDSWLSLAGLFFLKRGGKHFWF